jgi:hypothetical protein
MAGADCTPPIPTPVAYPTDMRWNRQHMSLVSLSIWEKRIDEILDIIDHRGEIDGKVVLLCRQVDDVAIAYSDPTVVQGLVDSIGKVWIFSHKGSLGSFNGIDIDQRRSTSKPLVNQNYTYAESRGLG